MRSLRLVLALVALSAGAAHGGKSLLGARKCTYGPSYWCQGLRQSAECGATSHCIDSYWEAMTLPVDDDDVCKICKDMVKQARDQLRSNETLSELQQVFDGSCRLIPVKPIADECVKLADDFIVQLVETLSSEMDPGVVCAVAGLCNSDRVDRLLAQYHATQTPTECSVCRRESQKLADKVASMARLDVEYKLLELCGHAGSYADACKATVQDNFGEIYSILSNLGDGQLCDLVGLCRSGDDDTNTAPAVYEQGIGKPSLECQFCEKVIKHWVDVWTTNTTEAEFKEVLDSLCHKMSNEARVKRCLHIVDDYYIPWFDFLAHEVNPEEVCTVFGLCGKGYAGFLELHPDTAITTLFPTRSQGDDEVPLTSLLPAAAAPPTSESQQQLGDAMGSLDVESQGLVGGYFVPQTVTTLAAKLVGPEMTGWDCTVCQIFIETISGALKSNRTSEFIYTAFDDICKVYYPDQDLARCDEITSLYRDAVMEDIDMALDGSFCVAMNLCAVGEVEQDPATLAEREQLGMPTPDTQVKLREQQGCRMCHVVFDNAYSLMNDTSDIRAITDFLDDLCPHLPAFLSEDCDKLITEVTAPAAHMLLNTVPTDRMCYSLHMCPPNPNLKTGQCLFCNYLVNTVTATEKTHQGLKDTVDVLSGVCDMMPRNLAVQCQSFVDDYASDLFDSIGLYVHAPEICSGLRQCADAPRDRMLAAQMAVEDTRKARQIASAASSVAAIAASAAAASSSQEEGEGERPYCALCEYAIGELFQALEDKKDEEKIKEELDKICYKLSQPVAKECVKIIDQYTDQIVHLIVEEYTPHQICQEIKLCQQQAHLQQVSPPSTNEIPDMVFEKEDVEEEEEEEGSNPLCIMCEFAVTFVESKLITNRTFDIAERAIQMFCAQLPNSVAEKCEKFVDDYGDEIIRMIIEEELSPQEICTAVQLCLPSGPAVGYGAPSGMYDASALGGKLCVWGPSYWCQSRFHARQCGTTRHCEQHVWN